MDRTYILEKITGYTPGINAVRGDHDLNPGMLPDAIVPIWVPPQL